MMNVLALPNLEKKMLSYFLGDPSDVGTIPGKTLFHTHISPAAILS